MRATALQPAVLIAEMAVEPAGRRVSRPTPPPQVE